MNTEVWAYISYGVFSGSILLIIYIVYYEWKTAKIMAERDEIEMGEMKIEDDVNRLTDTELANNLNEELGGSIPNPPKKPT